MKRRKANKNDEELRKTVKNKEKLTEKKTRETIKKPGPPWGAHLEKIDRDLRTSNPPGSRGSDTPWAVGLKGF